jgi:hypothetical protein
VWLTLGGGSAGGINKILKTISFGLRSLCNENQVGSNPEKNKNKKNTPFFTPFSTFLFLFLSFSLFPLSTALTPMGALGSLMASHSPPLDALVVPSEDYHQVLLLFSLSVINFYFLCEILR